MKKKYYIPFVLGSLLFIAALFTGCDDDDDLGQAPRLFTPVINETTIAGNSIYLKWDKYAGTERYSLSISKDTFKTDPIAVYETDTSFFTIKDLEWDTKYQVAIKAFGNNIESYTATTLGLKTDDYPTRLVTPTAEDVIDNAVRVKWVLDDEAYTSLQVTNSKDEVLKTITLTSDEYAESEMIINGLSPTTTYKVRAYIGNDYKGKKTYTTLAAQVFSGSVVDLRSMSDDEALNVITNDFIAGLEDNSTVVLNGGTVYKISGATFTEKTVKFITGYSFRGMAEFAISSDFKLSSGTPTSKLEFQSIYFYTPDVDNTTANYGGKYIFNLNPGKATYVSFEGCKFEYFRGIARLQGAGSEVGKMIINNSIINRVAGYGVMNVDNAGATLGEMVLTNSTISFADKVLVNSKATTTTAVTVTNCTFCYAPAAGSTSYMFDFNGQKPAIQLKNNIFGPSTTGEGAPYFRAASAPTVENCYATSDYIVYINPTTLLETGPIPDIIRYAKSSTELFADPGSLDFTIKDKTFPGASTAGDRRWKP